MTITPIYAAALTLLFLILSFRVVFRRNTAKAMFGDAGDDELMRRIRAHGNFAEFAPLGLLLVAIAELAGAAGWAVHLAGAMLVLGRVLHALSVARIAEMPFRMAGMILTFTALALGAILALV